MCGRYLATSDPSALAERFAVDTVTVTEHRPRFNVAPSTDVYAVVQAADERRLGQLRWGFVPPWAARVGGSRQPINARLETVAQSRMFGPAFERRRCVLPADGFYEWQKRGEGRTKQPFHIADPDGAPLAFAGIWTRWHDPADPDADAVSSTAILTTQAAGAMRDIHERMPVMLTPALIDDWLDTAAEAPHLLDALTAMGAPPLVATPISTRVNNVRNDGPELLAPERVED